MRELLLKLRDALARIARRISGLYWAALLWSPADHRAPWKQPTSAPDKRAAKRRRPGKPEALAAEKTDAVAVSEYPGYVFGTMLPRSLSGKSREQAANALAVLIKMQLLDPDDQVRLAKRWETWDPPSPLRAHLRSTAPKVAIAEVKRRRELAAITMQAALLLRQMSEDERWTAPAKVLGILRERRKRCKTQEVLRSYR